EHLLQRSGAGDALVDARARALRAGRGGATTTRARRAPPSARVATRAAAAGICARARAGARVGTADVLVIHGPVGFRGAPARRGLPAASRAALLAPGP